MVTGRPEGRKVTKLKNKIENGPLSWFTFQWRESACQSLSNHLDCHMMMQKLCSAIFFLCSCLSFFISVSLFFKKVALQ